MNSHVAASPLWMSPARSAAESAWPSDVLPSEVKALGAHAQQCRSGTGFAFRAQCAAEAVHAFIAPRFVTTLAAVTAVIGLGVFVF